MRKVLRTYVYLNVMIRFAICRYSAGVHSGVHLRADTAVSTALDESGRTAAAESKDTVSLAHERDAGKRSADLRQRAQA